MLSLNSAVVSTAPRGHAANISRRGSVAARFPANIAPNFRYWLPIVGCTLSHVGWFGSAGGFKGSNPAWHEAHDAPYMIVPPGPGALRTPRMPVAEGSAHRSGPPAGLAVQSGSLITPHTSNRTERGVATARSNAMRIRFAGSGWFARKVKNFS